MKISFLLNVYIIQIEYIEFTLNENRKSLMFYDLEFLYTGPLYDEIT